MHKHAFSLALIGCAMSLAAVPALAGPSKSDLEQALSACPPGQSQGQDGVCAPSQGDQMGYDFIPQGTGPAASPHSAAPSQVAKSIAVHQSDPVANHIVVATAERPGAVDRGFADLQITFPNGGWELTPEDRRVADTLVQVMLQPGYRDKIAEIGGHTSNTGDRELNEELSKKRADAVKDYLVAKGVPADRLRAVGYGATQPIRGTDPAGAENRRVVLTALGTKQP